MICLHFSFIYLGEKFIIYFLRWYYTISLFLLGSSLNLNHTAKWLNFFKYNFSCIYLHLFYIFIYIHLNPHAKIQILLTIPVHQSRFILKDKLLQRVFYHLKIENSTNPNRNSMKNTPVMYLLPYSFFNLSEKTCKS